MERMKNWKQQYKKLSNARKIAGSAGEAYALTGENGGTATAADMISNALQRIQTVQEYDEPLQSLGSQLTEIENLLSDFNREMSGYLDDLIFDEYEFEKLEKRLDLINHLKVKYGNSIKEIQQYRDEKEKRLEELQNYDVYLDDLRKDYEEQEQHSTEKCRSNVSDS